MKMEHLKFLCVFFSFRFIFILNNLCLLSYSIHLCSLFYGPISRQSHWKRKCMPNKNLNSIETLANERYSNRLFLMTTTTTRIERNWEIFFYWKWTQTKWDKSRKKRSNSRHSFVQWLSVSLIIGGEILEFSYQRFGTIKTTKFSSHVMVVLEFDFGIERKIEIRKRNNGKRKNDTKYSVTV